ncbi:hypothetical protein DXG03_004719 [Asterophora parasitica]|uniref:DH domain-containing protein n=1 Tax=Asterophora parasitica TaxID=117018 RepID=A0A9P7KEH8_9AGAR|nr:hypothetical protein DXG03_004719 [Asterophora parasitica]
MLRSDVVISLDSEEALRRFQAAELPEIDQAWHRLVPPEARDALGPQEVQRQSVIFEIFKAEREYVDDLEAVEEAPVLGDDFRSAYETYIKHYLLSESYHRTELKRNPAYRDFVQSVATDPRIRKRDLITFLSRPVTRLPRLNLVLEQILKLTDKENEHPDLETLPIVLGILGDFIKSTQPGIAAAESKVKFWALCESLVFQKGEIIDMDLYEESRSLVYSGALARQTSESGWSGHANVMDLSGSLLDNYFLLTRDEKRSNGTIRRHLVSRVIFSALVAYLANRQVSQPLPLAYLRLGSFELPVETRKEKPDRLFENILGSSTITTVYPFTIYHASSRASRRYIFYVTSDEIRKKWYSFLVDAIGVFKARHEGNMWFYQRPLTDGFFRVAGIRIPHGSTAPLSGKITCALPFSHGHRKFIAVGCQTGIYASEWGDIQYRRVFRGIVPFAMAAIENVGSRMFNKFIVYSAENGLVSYSLDLVAQAALGQVQIGYIPRDAFAISPLVKTVGICAKDGIVIVDPTKYIKLDVFSFHNY